MADNKTNTKQPAVAAKNQDFDLQHTADRAQDFYTKNKNVINIGLLAIVVIIGGFFAYNRFVKAPNEKKAQEAIFGAQHFFAVDSFKLALNGDGNTYGFLQVIDKYGGTKAGNLAKYSAGVCFVKLGDYQKGIDQLKAFSSSDLVIQSLANGLIGDAYMELNKADDAVSYYKKAGAADNMLTSPIYLLRAGLALEKANKPQDAIAVYEQIKQKYPQTNEGREIEKYLARLGVVK
ncbi:tetratricopeptide repeat protein [Chitinophaga sp. SYP-B3965]|uniref:tetratricopeptide repeat protein n=1 Tax=Chitinophaga sp. SYP-B3965 TaxID=2663120 RepID=UPI001299F926|nr:tetratricopeptide repeat protein [Chitinophaga sp. SYP-B3965]MRG44497.1 tetratricopeptide repeat protein [Chitinophaga sp. SYP-B3965]